MIQRILDIYSQTSGQAVNFAKNSIAFSANMRLYEQQSLEKFLGVQLVETYELYLGLLTFVGKKKKLTFLYIKERVRQRLCSLKNKYWVVRAYSYSSRS